MKHETHQDLWRLGAKGLLIAFVLTVIAYAIGFDHIIGYFGELVNLIK